MHFIELSGLHHLEHNHLQSVAGLKILIFSRTVFIDVVEQVHYTDKNTHFLFRPIVVVLFADWLGLIAFSCVSSLAVNQTASAIPKTWRKPNEGISAGDAPQKEEEVTNNV